jgi:DNA polymerase I-like protein with 3'-5' exonuclease and polymerase domains
MRGQYVEGYIPWDSDGRIHTTFGQKPTNLRANSFNPNVQNVIQKGKYAQPYREQFIPKPGHVLAELDHSGAEAQITGFCAEDEEYIRIAKLSIHGILASYVLVNDGVWKTPIELSWSDDDIRLAVEEIEESFPDVYKRSKNCAHGSNYGAVPYKLFMEYRDAFPTLAFAQEIQELYFGTVFKKGIEWHHKTWEQTYRDRYIDNVYGYRFWFWDVLSPNWYGDLEIDNRTGYWKLGQQAKDCLAFIPSSTEAAYMREGMIWLADNTDLIQYLVWMIHDSLVWELPHDGKLGERLQTIQTAMSMPSPQMGGLSIEVGVDVGMNWGKRSKFNPLGMQDWTKFQKVA